jgi:ATP-dependent Clp protease ATP-binding subunit ClpC
MKNNFLNINFSTLLQVSDEGHLTDGLGRKINFKNYLIIMTSNLGVKKLQEFGSGIGFQKKDYVVEEQKRDTLKKELQKFFAPEFLNRIDDIIVFNTLKEEHVKEIVKIELIKLTDRLTKIKYNFKFDDSIIDMISKVGFDEMYGARPLKRAIQDKIEDYISEEVLKGELLTGHNYTVSVEDDVITVTEDKKLKKGKTKKEVE